VGVSLHRWHRLENLEGAPIPETATIWTAPALGSPRGVYKKSLEIANSLNRGPVGKHAGGTPLPGTSKIEIIFLSGDLVHYGLREICKRRLWNGHLSPLGSRRRNTPLLGTLKDG
jgi:hypothetical protein